VIRRCEGLLQLYRRVMRFRCQILWQEAELASVPHHPKGGSECSRLCVGRQGWERENPCVVRSLQISIHHRFQGWEKAKTQLNARAHSSEKVLGLDNRVTGLARVVQRRRSEPITTLLIRDRARRCAEVIRQVFQVSIFPFQFEYPLRHGFRLRF